ncbi:MAG: RNA polymerase sigma factor [Defluviitaleaceae bacterium]|nr:RNA polymerase sigma factor [Defluviitaleaceae bacterium]
MLIILAFDLEADKNTFEYLYEKYKRLLWSKAFDILKDHALAEDAVSEAFIRVYRHLHKIKDPDSNQTIAFLVTIVKNIAINLYHRKNKSLPVDINEHDQVDSFNLEEFIASKEEASQAISLIDKLNEDLKSVFLLKYAHDLSHKEIGKILNISENNVTVRLHRARKKLMQLMKEV